MDNGGLTETQAMDKQIAERLFGWKNVRYDARCEWLQGTSSLGKDLVPRYSTSLCDAWPVWNWIRERWATNGLQTQGMTIARIAEYVAAESKAGKAKTVTCLPWLLFEADVPLTLCRVALALLDAEEAKHND